MNPTRKQIEAAIKEIKLRFKDAPKLPDFNPDRFGCPSHIKASEWEYMRREARLNFEHDFKNEIANNASKRVTGSQ